MGHFRDMVGHASRTPEQIAEETARKLRVQLAQGIAALLRAEAALLLKGAAADGDAAACEARLAVRRAAIKAAAQFERGDLS